MANEYDEAKKIAQRVADEVNPNFPLVGRWGFMATNPACSQGDVPRYPGSVVYECGDAGGPTGG